MPDVIRTRFQKQWVAAAAPVIDYYRGHGLVAPHRRRPCRASRWPAALDALLDGLDGAHVIVRKTDAEVETMARAGSVVAETLDLVERAGDARA